MLFHGIFGDGCSDKMLVTTITNDIPPALDAFINQNLANLYSPVKGLGVGESADRAKFHAIIVAHLFPISLSLLFSRLFANNGFRKNILKHENLFLQRRELSNK